MEERGLCSPKEVQRVSSTPPRALKNLSFRAVLNKNDRFNLYAKKCLLTLVRTSDPTVVSFSAPQGPLLPWIYQVQKAPGCPGPSWLVWLICLGRSGLLLSPLLTFRIKLRSQPAGWKTSKGWAEPSLDLGTPVSLRTLEGSLGNSLKNSAASGQA